MNSKIIFLQEQLRQLHEKATDMTIGNYLAVKRYYESRLRFCQPK